MHHQARDAVASRLATQFTHFVSFTVEIAKHSTYYSQHITRHIKTNGKGAHLIAWRSSRLNSNTSTPRDVGLTQFRRCVCSHAVTVHTRHQQVQHVHESCLAPLSRPPFGNCTNCVHLGSFGWIHNHHNMSAEVIELCVAGVMNSCARTEQRCP